jgi:hypothetical protein
MIDKFIYKKVDLIAAISLGTQMALFNWLHEISELRLLKDDFSIGHIIHTGSIEVREDGSLLHSSKYNPKISVLNFYFGGATP